MNSRNPILNELSELNSSLPPNATEPVFTVPEGYFDNFAATVLAKIKGAPAESTTEELSALSPLLASIPKKMPYSIPEGYFSELTGGVPALIGEEALPSVLSEHDRRTPYQVPDGYFESLPAIMLGRVQKPRAKVIGINRQRWMRVAVAAVVAGIMTLGGLAYFNNKSTVDPTQNPDEWVASKLKGVSVDALENFIQEVTIGTNGNTELAQGAPAKREVRSMLNDVSDQELENFLEAVPTDEETALMN